MQAETEVTEVTEDLADRPGEVFDRSLFVSLCEQRGWNTDAKRARAFGFHQSTVQRVRTGEQTPSLSFSLACRRIFGVEAFLHLFPLPAPPGPGSEDS